MSATSHSHTRGFGSRHFFRIPPTPKGAWHSMLLLVLSLGLLSSTAHAKKQRYVITAYVFPQNIVLTSDQVAADKLTRINFAFANVDQGRIVLGDPSDAANLETLVGLKKENPDLTVLVSVGGWLWSGRFSDAALTPPAEPSSLTALPTLSLATTWMGWTSIGNILPWPAPLEMYFVRKTKELHTAAERAARAL